MTDTATRNSGAGQFCGNCGGAVRAYWNECPSCGTPLEVTPAASLAAAPAEPPPPAWSPPAPSYSSPGSGYPPQAPGYAPTGPSYPPPPAYPPPPNWSSTTSQYPASPPAYQPAYVPEPPSSSRSAKSGVWIALTIVLAVLFLAAGAYGLVTAGNLSTKKTDLVTRTRERDAARAALATTQGQLNDANTAKDSQSSQLAAYKACITDLNILFSSTTGTPAEVAADRQAQKDCVPLGLG